MIKSFLYKDFKCFQKAELYIENITTLIGTNSSGKSNAIEGMMILSEIVTGIDLMTVFEGTKNSGGGIRGGAKRCCRFMGERFTLGCTVEYSESVDLKYEVTINVHERPVIEEEKLFEVSPKERIIFSSKAPPGDSGDIAISINNGRKGRNPDVNCIKYYSLVSQLISKLPTETKYGKKAVDYCKKIIDELKNILYLSPEPTLMRGYSMIGDSELKVNASNISSVVYELCSDVHDKNALMDIMRRLPENEVEDISFAEGPLNDVILFLEERQGKGTTVQKMDATQLSDGTLRCLAIISALLSEKEGGMIVIEEIDNGIHPGRTKVLIKELAELSRRRKIDLVYSTHNPVLLNALNKEELLGVNLIYRSSVGGEGCIVPLVEIDDIPALLANGKLGDVFTDDSILTFVKQEKTKPDLSWLEAKA